ncbi:MAG: hypothetical protein ACK56Q_10235 [Pirellulaceae bacterium]
MHKINAKGVSAVANPVRTSLAILAIWSLAVIGPAAARWAGLGSQPPALSTAAAKKAANDPVFGNCEAGFCDPTLGAGGDVIGRLREEMGWPARNGTPPAKNDSLP